MWRAKGREKRFNHEGTKLTKEFTKRSEIPKNLGESLRELRAFVVEFLTLSGPHVRLWPPMNGLPAA
jgi:hypothetical protein